MTFREALEREITTQGISVGEVARKSRVSKGTIYNILNGTTEDARIRAATRRALAQGCDRELQVLPDGSVRFALAEDQAPPGEPAEIALRFLPFVDFMSQHHLREPFDWLYAQEESGALTGLNIVDRVFQRRSEFLGFEIHNAGDTALLEGQIVLNIRFDVGPRDRITCQTARGIAPDERVQQTLFLLAGPAFELTVQDAVFTDATGKILQAVQPLTYRFEGTES